MSLELILEEIDSLKTKPSDIVYSLEEELKSTYESLVNLRKSELHKLPLLKESKMFKATLSPYDGEPLVDSGNDNVINLLNIIDSELFLFRGNPLVLKMRRTEYRKALIEKKMELKDAIEDEVIREVDDILDNQQKISQDAIPIHHVLDNINRTITTSSDALDILEDVMTPDAASKLFNSAKLVYFDILNSHKGVNKKAVLLSNVVLTLELPELDKTLVGHLDYIVIDENGNLHLYLYKTSTQDVKDWVTVKMQKYKYQLAFLKQMLRAKGYSVSKCTLNIVPVNVKYDENYTQIVDAKVGRPIKVSHSDDKYLMLKEDIVVQSIIPSVVSVKPIQYEELTDAENEYRELFPGLNLTVQGVILTIDEWIDSNFDKGRLYRNEDGTYDLILESGDTLTVSDTTYPPKKNKELREVIQKNIKELNEEEFLSIKLNIINTVIAAYKDPKGRDGIETKLKNGYYISNLLKPYFSAMWNPKTKQFDYQWKIIENDALLNCGILLFQNVNGLIDVVSFTNYKVSASLELDFGGRTNIGGKWISDIDSGKLVRYKATVGNVEAVKVMLLLNKVLKNFDGDFTLGLLKIVSMANLGECLPYNFSNFEQECFSPLIKLSRIKIKNNFKRNNFTDPFDIIVKLAEALTNEAFYRDTLSKMGFARLIDPNEEVGKSAVLLELIQSMEKLYGYLKRKISDVYDLLITENPNSNKYKVAELYYMLLSAYSKINGCTINPNILEFSSIKRNIHTSNRDPDYNVRIFKGAVRLAISQATTKITDEFETPYEIINEYLKNKGYNTARRATIGDYNKVFKKFYKTDPEGNMLMEFINPYETHDPSYTLEDLEFLKKMLFFFAKVRATKRGLLFKFTIKDINSKEYMRFITTVLLAPEHGGWYFWAPLTRASKATLRQTPKKAWSDKKRKLMQIIKDPAGYIGENMHEALSKEDRDRRDEEAEGLLELRDPFDFGESRNGRVKLLNDNPNGAFETNIELLLSKFMSAQIMCEELNKAIVVGRSCELSLTLLGREANTDAVKASIKEIHDFAKVAVYRTSIMDKTSKRIVSVLAPIRRKVTAAYLAGNVISAFRDTFEGLWLNMARAINHYQTDINAKDVMLGYKEVVSKILTSALSMNKIDKLCRIYALSNFDKSNTASVITQTRTGIFNWENWAYSTLRRPDFLNRMVLFVAQCIHDGLWDAISMDGSSLKYDWRKDKRFSALAANDTNDPKYKELKALYYKLIRDYNSEHPYNMISPDLDLPIPYSIKLVEGFKNLSDSIYGAYDVATKSKYEWMMLGYVFGQFSTWMNGQINNYLASTDSYEDGPTELVLDLDNEGNLLYLDKNLKLVVEVIENGEKVYRYVDSGEICTEEVVPDMKDVPLNILGIWHTLCNCVKEIWGGHVDFKKNFTEFLQFKRSLPGLFTDNERLRANIRKLISDLLIWFLLANLFKLALTPEHEEYLKRVKANPDEYDPLMVALEGAIYKGGLRSYDGFRGLWNAVEYLGDNMDPPVYLFPVKLLNDLGRATFGNKTWEDVLVGNTAPFRMFQDVNKIYWSNPKVKKAEEEAEL